MVGVPLHRGVQVLLGRSVPRRKSLRNRTQRTQVITTNQIAWAAGLIEGEGTIIASITKREGGYPIRQFRLAVEMTDLDVLKRLAGILGPRVTLRERKPPSLNPKHRQRYILCLTGSELAGWLMTIYPLMGERRRTRIRESLLVWRSLRTTWRHNLHRVTPLRVDLGEA